MRSEAVNLAESAVAADQSAVRIEEGDALPDVFDCRLVARRLCLEARDHGRLFADDDLLRLDDGAA